MKKLCILLMTLCLLLGLAACGSTAPDNPNCGLYEGKYGEMSGFQIGIQDMYEKGFTVELGGGGKGIITVDGTKANLKWTLNGSSIHIVGTGVKGGDLVLDGTLADGVMVLENVMDSGVDIHLECASLLKEAPEAAAAAETPTEAPAPEAAETPVETPAPAEVDTPTAAPVEPAETASGYDWWNGYWYGWGCYYEAGGTYASLEDSAWDVFAKIDVQDDKGSLEIWSISDLDEAELSAKVSFGPGSTPVGKMTCESAEFADSIFERNAWSCDPGEDPEGELEHTFLLSFYYRDVENSDNYVQLCYILRPWGMLWDDVKDADTSKMLYEGDMMPFHYEDWYLPQLNGQAPVAPETPAEPETTAAPEIPAAPAADAGALVGSWAHEYGYVYTFNADGTGSYGKGDSVMTFTYTVEEDQLSILYDGSTAPFKTTFRIEGTTLIILDSFNNEVKYEKQ